jgi:hypothetical protein
MSAACCKHTLLGNIMMVATAVTGLCVTAILAILTTRAER